MSKIIKVTLDKKLNELGITRYELSKRTGILFPIIDKYYKNKALRYDRETLRKICIALDCDVGDILQMTEE